MSLNRDRIERRLATPLRVVVIVIAVVVSLAPFYYMVVLSFRPLADILRDPGNLFVAIKNVTMSGYEDVFKPADLGGQGFLVFMRNSLLISIGTVVACLLVAVPAAYAVTRLQFFGRRQISSLFLMVYFFPSILLAVPLFSLFTKLGLGQSLWALLIVYISQTIAVTIYMLKSYFATIPLSIEEAARLDGCGTFGVLWKVDLPLSLPSIFANGLYIFMIAWNEFLFALLFLAAKPSNWTVSLGLSQLSNNIEISTTTLMAGAVIITIPVAVLFLTAQRYLVDGFTAGAEKG